MIFICVLVQQEKWGADIISIIRKCAWCGEDFEVKSLFSRDKYCDKHKKEAQKSRKLKDRINHYKRNKKEVNVKELGTISLGQHARINHPVCYLGFSIPFSEFIDEQKVIKNNSINNNGVTGIYKGEKTNNYVWIDNCETMEYGEPQPSGIQNTHKYATFDDYYYTAKHYLLKERGRCPNPECESTEHYKSDKDICCAGCGWVLEVTTNIMSWTHQDVIDSEVTKKTQNPLTVQNIAWDKYWKEE
jgi:hypothetical protein